MPHREQLAFLCDCEAEAVERGHAAEDPEERDAHFATAAEFVVRIRAIEQQIAAFIVGNQVNLACR